MKNKTYTLLLIAGIILITGCNKNTEYNDNPPGNYIMTGYISGFCAVPCSYFYKAQNNQLKMSGAVRYYNDTTSFNNTGTTAEYNLVQSIEALIPDTLYTLNNQSFGCPNCHDQGGYYLTVSKNNQLYKWQLDPDVVDSSNHFLSAFTLQLRNILTQLPQN